MPVAREWADVAWVERTLHRANEDAAFAHKARWLTATVLLQVGGRRFALDIWRGRVMAAQEGAPLTGWDFAICGDDAAWQAVVDNAVELGEATTSIGAPLTIDGNQVLAATHWAAVIRLIDILATAAVDVR